MFLKKANILLVEDGYGEIVLAKEAFNEVDIPLNLHIIKDGEEAIKFIKKEGEYEKSPTPNLIILDISLPKISGIEVLKHIRADFHFRFIPVVMLTTSTYASDVEKSLNFGANAYLVKPFDYDEFTKLIKSVCDVWLRFTNKSL